MEKLFLPYNLSLALKEIGFDESCLAIWYCPDDIEYFTEMYFTTKNTKMPLAPLYDQVIEWFIEKYDICLHTSTTPVFDKMYPSKWKVQIGYCFQHFKWATGKYYIGDTRQDALNQGIEKAIELIKQKK